MTNLDWKNEELKERLGAGDPSAFKVVFDLKYPELCFFANKIVHDADEAEDIVMEVFTKFWYKRDLISGIKDLGSFLYTSVKNACLDHIRKQQRAPKIVEDLRSEAYTIDEVLESEAIYSSILRQIYTSIEALPPQCRTIFKLLYFEGKSTQEIAQILQLSVQSVRNQKTRAIQLLKIKIDPNHLLSVTLLQVLFDYLR